MFDINNAMGKLTKAVCKELEKRCLDPNQPLSMVACLTIKTQDHGYIIIPVDNMACGTGNTLEETAESVVNTLISTIRDINWAGGN